MPEILEAEILYEQTFDAVSPPTAGAITLFQPTPTFPYRNQQIPEPPRINDPGVDAAYADSIYRDSAGRQQWKPPGGFDDLDAPDPYIYGDDYVRHYQQNGDGIPYTRVPDPTPPGFRQFAGEAIPGSVAGGVVTGVVTYANTGSVAQAVGAGAGSAIGETIGTAAGAVAGSAFGPVGTVAGGVIGGAVGGAVGQLIGQTIGKMLDPNDLGDSEISYQDKQPAFTGGQCSGTTYLVTIDTGTGGFGNTAQAFGGGPIKGLRYIPVGNGNYFLGLVNTGFGGVERVDVFKTVEPQNLNKAKITNVQYWAGYIGECGDPEPTEPVTRTQPAVRVRTMPFGGFPPLNWDYDIPGQSPTGTGDQPYGKPWDIPDTFTELPPGTNPLTEPYPYPDPDAPPVGIDYPFPNPTGKPDSKTDDDDGRPVIRLNTDCECSTPLMRELEDIKDKLEDIDSGGSGQQQFAPTTMEPLQCEPEAAYTVTSLEGAIAHLSQQIRQVKTGVCDFVPVAAVPEHWQVKVGADRPQLAILLQEVGTDGKLGGSYWSMSVPHYAGPQDLPLELEYQKGKYYAVATLKDNSKIVCNAVSTEEAKRVVQQLAELVNPSLVPTPLDIQAGERNGKSFSSKTARAVRLQYYSTGQKNMIPDWEHDLRANGNS